MEKETDEDYPMTMQDARLMTVEEFEAFVELPENANKRFEFIGGEIIEVPNNAYSSEIASRISGYIFVYLLKNDIGHLTGEGGGFKVATERYAPDVAFTAYDTQKELDKKGYNGNPPDLAVEVVSSENKTEEDELTIKLSSYLSVGTMVWIVRPEKKTIEVHEAGKAGKVFRESDTIKLATVLPNFELKVRDIFKK
jgi:Uma2 family endonuclease